MLGDVGITVIINTVECTEAIVICYGIGSNGALIMEAHVIYVLGEEYLITFINGNCRILPEEEGVAQGCGIIKLYLGLENALAVLEGYADHTLHTVYGIVLGKPYSCIYHASR